MVSSLFHKVFKRKSGFLHSILYGKKNSLKCC